MISASHSSAVALATIQSLTLLSRTMVSLFHIPTSLLETVRFSPPRKDLGFQRAFSTFCLSHLRSPCPFIRLRGQIVSNKGLSMGAWKGKVSWAMRGPGLLLPVLLLIAGPLWEPFASGDLRESLQVDNGCVLCMSGSPWLREVGRVSVHCG